ncbi:MAG: hypothetical protein LAO04_20980 [Acidobacteriia bacterium]|nr:hypothetical protein [Terriglobia bacterium]
MKKHKKEPELMGAHWKDTNYSPLYQLSRRVETVARQLGDRRKKGWTSHKKHVNELYDISIQLKVLDKKIPH